MFRYILTAAHCFEQVKHKTNVDVDITLGGCFSMLRINHLKIFLLNQVNMTETEEPTMKCTELLELLHPDYLADILKSFSKNLMKT